MTVFVLILTWYYCYYYSNTNTDSSITTAVTIRCNYCQNFYTTTTITSTVANSSYKSLKVVVYGLASDTVCFKATKDFSVEMEGTNLLNKSKYYVEFVKVNIVK